MKNSMLWRCSSSNDTIFVNIVSDMSLNSYNSFSDESVIALDASFSENFYGLKRRRRPWVETVRAQAAVGGIPPEEKLQNRDIQRSLLFLVRIVRHI